MDDGSSAAQLNAFRKALETEKAMVKIVCPKVQGATLDDDSELPANGELSGTKSVIFDAVVSILPPASASKLSAEAAAQDWFRDAFAHLKAIALCNASRKLFEGCGLLPDAGVFSTEDVAGFIEAAKGRCWEREPTLRDLP